LLSRQFHIVLHLYLRDRLKMCEIYAWDLDLGNLKYDAHYYCYTVTLATAWENTHLSTATIWLLAFIVFTPPLFLLNLPIDEAHKQCNLISSRPFDES